MRDTHLLSVTSLMIADQVNVSRWGDDRQWACRQRERECGCRERNIYEREDTNGRGEVCKGEDVERRKGQKERWSTTVNGSLGLES